MNEQLLHDLWRDHPRAVEHHANHARDVAQERLQARAEAEGIAKTFGDQMTDELVVQNTPEDEPTREPAEERLRSDELGRHPYPPSPTSPRRPLGPERDLPENIDYERTARILDDVLDALHEFKVRERP